MARLRHARSLALIAPFLALVLAAAQLGSAVHLAAVQHVVCADHGEVVDVGHAAPAVDGARDLFTAVPEAHGHEHCAQHALVTTRPSFIASFVLRLVEAERDPSTPRVVPARSIAILHLAPKSSPPSLRS